VWGDIQREAQTVSALNHLKVYATICEMNQEIGWPFAALVLEGITLNHRRRI